MDQWKLFHAPMEILLWIHRSHQKATVTKDMEFPTCIEDVWTVGIPSITVQRIWKFQLVSKMHGIFASLPCSGNFLSVHGNNSTADYDTMSFFAVCIFEEIQRS
jgi:hypothetical protein